MRSAVAQAQQGAQTAGQTGGQLIGQAGETLGAMQLPLQGIMKSGMTPQEMNNALVAAQQESGGAESGIVGQANLMAARARNPGAQTAALDEAARQKMRQDSQSALNIQNMALNRQMQGLGIGADIYGTQLRGAMQAYGLVPQDVEAAARANQTGWVQDTSQILSALRGRG